MRIKFTSTVMSKGGDQVQLKNISTMWENGQEKRVSNRPLSSQVSLFTSSPMFHLDHIMVLLQSIHNTKILICYMSL